MRLTGGLTFLLAANTTPTPARLSPPQKHQVNQKQIHTPGCTPSSLHTIYIPTEHSVVDVARQVPSTVPRTCRLFATGLLIVETLGKAGGLTLSSLRCVYDKWKTFLTAPFNLGRIMENVSLFILLSRLSLYSILGDLLQAVTSWQLLRRLTRLRVEAI